MAASWKYFGVRTLNALVVIVIVVFILSALFSTLAEKQLETHIKEQLRAEMQNLEPGINQTAWRQQREATLEKQYNLDKPTYIRIFYSAADTLMLDFGTSNSIQAPGGGSQVSDIIMSRLPRTVLLFTTAAVIYIILGLIVGLKAAQVAGSKLDKFISLFGMAASSIPMWWLGMLVIQLFGFELGWFPPSAFPFPIQEEVGWDGYIVGVLKRMAMPLFTIVFVYFGARAWATRNIVTGVLQDDYIMAARAKGVPERKVIYGHTLKSAAPPIVTSAILAFLLSIGGAMITEIIFGWPGMGRLMWTAIQRDDVPVLMGVAFITVFLYVVGYLIADLIYGLLDPRVEVGAERSV